MTALQRALGLDTRSLVVARLLLGAALMHNAITAAAWPYAVRIAACIIAAALFAGLRTTLACMLGYLCLVLGFWLAGPGSVDTLLAILLLLGTALPLAMHWSVDAALDSGCAPSATTPCAPPVPRTIVSVATIAVTIQLLLVVLRSAESTFMAGAGLRQAGLLNALALVFPMLVLAPLPGGVVRAMGVLALGAGAVFFTPTLGTGVGKLTLCAGLAALLPAALWQWLGRIPRLRAPTGLHIYFDRDCGFCRKTCYLFRSFMLLGATPITPAQDDAQIFAIMERDNTWVVTDHDGTQHTRWRAVLLLLRRSPVWWPAGSLLTALGMGRWGDPLYGLIAASRGLFSKITAVLLPYRSERPLHGPLVNGLLAVWLVLVVVFSFARFGDVVAADSALTGVATMLGIVQNWNLW